MTTAHEDRERRVLVAGVGMLVVSAFCLIAGVADRAGAGLSLLDTTSVVDAFELGRRSGARQTLLLMVGLLFGWLGARVLFGRGVTSTTGVGVAVAVCGALVGLVVGSYVLAGALVVVALGVHGYATRHPSGG